ncbi:uncharacterized protein LOC111913320 isoform X1 [Lactuca sativa]|uniref:uncharacterized protein LOC111913320 isoform X1 n=1 Tax=Lactuca sativa TaxID=4236 RepID=UPI0022AFF0CA|nr:uncharacterized protein LOC111913320 isoform X1 [Lactuca sativa]XP_052624448.1 uncharacterized protein LOC111913320 isoform X1 [Lactuca sativa]XP_052624449.1 uncharacterized protein LOC111913320 isoform X1 [Lactuca sativa]XP_052624450.1 uncharacterized protein LOC111913320 isoform X1 [Lactuca sativa]XP_052624451.1 uncharacterized protein LOC111913320 isoform X1 [Lactuca sativa]
MHGLEMIYVEMVIYQLGLVSHAPHKVYAVLIVGPFPTTVTNLLDLTRLDLHNNKLIGPIPPQIVHLKRLKILGKFKEDTRPKGFWNHQPHQVSFLQLWIKVNKTPYSDCFFVLFYVSKFGLTPVLI